ncbi:hypothetical protein GUITHDRAFT_150518 [Guillardia theta CCMP2712]|uniref:Uncharacterized protein n=1 Tax=Guillardia theta (strain CCMP2712) TaxID=905079 RepID=L1JXY8_GUITC|nr:hypothetical protein GUITHDRAFT_150518 [Guillardia theta CCMP2712]EKX53080.1 hypothetical protein GUITHDRAFT_150518 [Guillardia theta CCMP2712]|eukprot:XP_005840060.1 hypothetical protein GUITHDRAFT_150518 [Guillardia theta CCMP2712]
MKQYFASKNMNVDYILFTSYEAQVEALMNKQIDIAWNGPLAHCRVKQRTNNASLSLGMRDCDRDFQSHIIVTEDSGIKALKELEGQTIAAGTVDSPQAYILPLHHLKKQGVNLKSLSMIRFDRDVGKHGDTAEGEVLVMEALKRGEAAAGLVSDLMWQRALSSGKVNADGKKMTVLKDAPPPFDHCQFDALPGLEAAKKEAFQEALFAMDWNNKFHQEIMKMEGITRTWAGPRDEGYAMMQEIVDSEPNVPYPRMLHDSSNHPFKSLLIK